MPEVVQVDDLIVQGNLTVGGKASPTDASVNTTHFTTAAAIKRSKLAQDTLRRYPIPMYSARRHDTFSTLLASVAGGDRVAIEGNVGTSPMYISGGDINNAGAVNRYARFLVAMPPAYDARSTVNIVANAGMITQIADDSSNLDFSAYKCDRFGVGISADLISTAAQNINSLTFAEYTFAMTTTSLHAGDMIDLRLELDMQDDNPSLTVEARVGALWLECDIRG